ncbi:MAG: phosphate/phosphite/phosphonate ABC transporter substrate-binding protein [Azoarcus sp.]|jgi:phosphonate transport system substrate-binding protein|nr:phosphate/phosphite/phosphonate ABC transporter substrate-binding protein [Azoarcus sp.]
MFRKCTSFLVALIVTCGLASVAFAAAPCKNSGNLAARYCDADGDLTADPPADSKEWEDPDTLVFGDTPLEDIEDYADIFNDFMKFLSAKTGKKVEYRPMASNSSGIEDMRSGRLHIASFSTGATGYAVNLAGYVPIAVKGTEKEFQGYRLIVLVKKDSPYQKLHDIKGKKVAHTGPTSNSGHIAPMALFPQEGVTPGKDYEIVFSGNHEKSVLGVLKGEYDAACVGSSLYDRVVNAGDAKADDFRTIWRSSQFPTSSFGYVYNLKPELAQKIRAAFFEYRFTPKMINAFGKTDRFSPATYIRDYKLARMIAVAGGEKFDEMGLKAMAESEKKTAARTAPKKAPAP